MAEGYIVTQVYTSRGVIPVSNASVTVTQEKNGKMVLLGIRKTNQYGRTDPITVETPDEDLSTSPGTETPFSTCNIQIEHPEYYTYFVMDAQVFANNTTVQNADLVPLEEQANSKTAVEKFQVVPQNL